MGSQWPGISRILSPSPSRLVAAETASRPCSSEARSYVAAGSSQTSGGPRIERERLQAGIDDGAVFGRPAHHLPPYLEARLESLGRRAVAVAIAPAIGVHEDVRAASQFGVDAARRRELESAGYG